MHQVRRLKENYAVLRYKASHFETIPHRKPFLRSANPHSSRSFLNNGSPPVKTTVTGSDVRQIVSTAFRKSSRGISEYLLSLEQSLPQCRQLRLHRVVHSQNKYLSSCTFASCLLKCRNKRLLICCLKLLSIYFS